VKKSSSTKFKKDFWQKRKVLITGGCGYLGRELVKNLISLGSFITVIDKTKKENCPIANQFPEVDLISEELNQINVVFDILKSKNIQTVIHLAAQSGVPGSQANPVAAFQANVQTTWSLLEACRLYGKVSEIVHVSSNHIYGDQKEKPTLEEAPLNSFGVYGASKACSDLIARCYAKSYGLPIGIARVTNTFGGEDPHLTHIITYTINKVLKGEPPIIKSHGLNSKGFLFLEDTIEAIKLLTEKINELNLKGEAFNFAPDEPIKIIDLVNKITKLTGETYLKPVILGKLTDPVEEEWLSNKKAKKILGWHPKYSLEEGLKITIDYFLRKG